jgi:branched-chain amino acid aminotransferase
MSQSDHWVYFDGRILPLSEAKLPVLTHAFHYGTGVFEGIRAYWAPDEKEMFLFRVNEHYARWKANCRILGIEPQMGAPELSALTAELIRRNQFETDVYVRPLAYTSSPKVGVKPDGKFNFAIVPVPFGTYLPSENGIRAGVVSWRRVEDTAIPCRAKITGTYVNSVLATMEAAANGFDEAILLSENGHVAEGATCNLFLVRGRQLITPPPSDNILEGITRASIMELARREMRLEVVERSIDRTELYVADECFLTGTAVELAPVVNVDHRDVGAGTVGPVTKCLRDLYRESVRGGLLHYAHWLTPVYRRAAPRNRVVFEPDALDLSLYQTIGL